MKRKRFTEEQIIRIVKEHGLGAKATDLCRKHGISEATFYNWKSRYGGMEVSEAKWLKALENYIRSLGSNWQSDVDMRLTQSGSGVGSTWTLTDSDDSVETYTTINVNEARLELDHGAQRVSDARSQ